MESEISKLLSELMYLSVTTRLNGGDAVQLDRIIMKYQKHYQPDENSKAEG